MKVERDDRKTVDMPVELCDRFRLRLEVSDEILKRDVLAANLPLLRRSRGTHHESPEAGVVRLHVSADELGSQCVLELQSAPPLRDLYLQRDGAVARRVNQANIGLLLSRDFRLSQDGVLIASTVLKLLRQIVLNVLLKNRRVLRRSWRAWRAPSGS